MSRLHGGGASLVVLFLMFLISGFLAAVLIFMAYRASTSKHWPTTEGVVVAFFETPNYRYQVNGQSYTNDNVSCNEFTGMSSTAQNSEKYSVRYPPEAKGTGPYHPDKPGIAALETEFDPSVFKVIGIFLLMNFM